jgi:hypothetical protein
MPTQKAGRKAPVSQAKAPAKTQGGKAPVTQAKAPAKTQGGKSPATSAKAPAKTQGGKAPATSAKAPAKIQGGKAPTSQAKAPAKIQGGKAPTSQAKASAKTRGGGEKDVYSNILIYIKELFDILQKYQIWDNYDILNTKDYKTEFIPIEKDILKFNESKKLQLFGFLQDVFKPTFKRTNTQRINNLMNDRAFLYKINELLSYYCLHINNESLLNPNIRNKTSSLYTDTIKTLNIMETTLIKNAVHIINYELYKLNFKKIKEQVELSIKTTEQRNTFVDNILNSYEESKNFLNVYAHLSRIVEDEDYIKDRLLSIDEKKDINKYYNHFKVIIKELLNKLTISRIDATLNKEELCQEILMELGSSVRVSSHKTCKQSLDNIVNNLGIFPDMEAFYRIFRTPEHDTSSKLKAYIIQLIQTRESAISLSLIKQPVIDELEDILVYFVPFMINKQLQEQREKEKQLVKKLVIHFIKATKLDEFIHESRRTSNNMIAKCRSGLKSLNWNKGTYEFESNWKEKFLNLNEEDEQPFNTLGKGIHYVLNKCPNEFKIHLDNLKNKANTLNQANKLKFILNDSKLEIKNRAKVIISIEKFIKRYLNDVQAWT